jgi:hypothetical protein
VETFKNAAIKSHWIYPADQQAFSYILLSLFPEVPLMRFKTIMLVSTVLILSSLQINAAIPTDYTGKPYSGDTINGKPHQIPGIIKSVFFDEGGEKVAFHDETPGNTGGSMRKNASGQTIQADQSVDMQPFQSGQWADYNVNGSFEPLGSWHLGWVEVNDWLKFTVHVNTTGVYYVSLKQAMADYPNLATITINDETPDSIKNVKKVIVPPGCSEPYHAWDIYPNVDSIALDSGLFVLKYHFLLGGLNFDWIKFTLKNATSTTPRFVQQAARPVNLTTHANGSVLNVAYTSNHSGVTRLSVVDCAGRTVLPVQVKNTTSGLQNATFNLHALSNGIYIVRAEQAGTTESQIVAVRK